MSSPPPHNPRLVRQELRRKADGMSWTGGDSGGGQALHLWHCTQQQTPTGVRWGGAGGAARHASVSSWPLDLPRRTAIAASYLLSITSETGSRNLAASNEGMRRLLASAVGRPPRLAPKRPRSSISRRPFLQLEDAAADDLG